MELIMWLLIGLIAAILIGCTPLIPIAVVVMLIVVLVTMVRYHRDRLHGDRRIAQALRSVGHSTMTECSAHACACGRRIRTLRYRINKINNRIDHLTQLHIIDSSLPYDSLPYNRTIALLERIRSRCVRELNTVLRTRLKLNKVLSLQEGVSIEQPVKANDEIVPLSEKYLE